VLAGLADGRRRWILATLRTPGQPIAAPALVRRLAACEGTLPGPTAGSPGLKRVHTSLRHAHVPALASAGLLEWDEAAATVALADRQPVDKPAFRDVVTAKRDLDAILGCLADPSRRAIVSALSGADGPVDRRRLATHRCTCTESSDLADDAVERALIALRHEHLPALADAGLVRDGGERVVATEDERLAVVDPLLAIMFDDWDD
jgi:DNA-binding transcriptional ArsR family regulator